MNLVIWLTAGILAKAGVGGTPAPAPAPETVSKGGGSVKRYKQQKLALEMLLRNTRAQHDLEAQVGFCLSAKAEKIRGEYISKAIRDVVKAAGEIEDKLEEGKSLKVTAQELLETGLKEKVALDMYEKCMLHCEQTANDFYEHHVIKGASEDEDVNHQQCQEMMDSDASSHEAMLEEIHEATEKATRVREIELELAVLRHSRQVELDIMQHIQGLPKPAAVSPSKSEVMAEKIAEFYRSIA